MSAPISRPDTLLRACSLLFLFRALAMGRGDNHRTAIEAQIRALIAELVPCEGVAVRIGTESLDLPEAAGARRIELPLMVRDEPAGGLGH